jgi:hypothetical protein
MNKFEILVEILFRKTRGNFTKVTLAEIVSGFNLTSEKSSPERGISNYGDSQFTTCFKKRNFGILDIQSPWRVLDLDGGDFSKNGTRRAYLGVLYEPGGGCLN